MTEVRRVDEVVNADGTLLQGGYTAWDCDCGNEIRRYRGVADITCAGCGQEFNSGGQRLRSDWRSNRSNYDDDVSDMDGYEASQGDY